MSRNINSRSSTSSISSADRLLRSNNSLETRNDELINRKLIYSLLLKIRSLLALNVELSDKLTLSESRCFRLEEKSCEPYNELLAQKDATLALRDCEIVKLREEISRMRLPLPAATSRLTTLTRRSLSKAPEIVQTSPKGSVATSRAKLRQTSVVFPIRSSVPRR